MFPNRSLIPHPTTTRSLQAYWVTAALAGSALLWSACSGDKDSSGNQMQQAAPPPDASQQVPPPPAGSGQGEMGMSWTTPAGWTQQQPSSSMRKAQFLVPGAAGPAELVVFYFGPNQGGDPMSNAERWAGQFKKPDGTPAVDEMKTEHAEFGGMKTLLTEVEGVYRNSMVGQESFPDYQLLGAVVEGPDANWFFKLTGPKATIAENRDAFLAFLSSLRQGS